jgi:bacterioferritin-associated ferredoxin
MAGASDPANEGLTLAATTAAQLKALPGVRGIHILCGGCEELAGQVIQAAGLV